MSDPQTTPPSPSTPLPPGTAPDEHAMEVRLSKLLIHGRHNNLGRGGAGGHRGLCSNHSTDTLDFRKFQTHSDELNAPSTIFSRALSLDAPAIMQLGVLLLVLTPVARVAFTLIAFLIRRDWMSCAIAAIVLAVLGLGLSGVRVH